jgi:hypothetical protein
MALPQIRRDSHYYSLIRSCQALPWLFGRVEYRKKDRDAALSLFTTGDQKQQAAHPGLTITGMYNVLEKLRTGEALTAKDKKIHDDLDAAVFDAYGWPANLSDDEILERLVDLNHERAAEEKRGLVRWLRPEFQNKVQNQSQNEAGGGDGQTMLDGAEGDDADADGGDEPAAEKPKRGREAAKKSKTKAAATNAAAEDPLGEPQANRKAAKAAKAVKLAWPKDLAEQTRGVRAALAAFGGIASAADVAGQFKHAKTPRVEEILDTLVALGHARRTDDGYAPA